MLITSNYAEGKWSVTSGPTHAGPSSMDWLKVETPVLANTPSPITDEDKDALLEPKDEHVCPHCGCKE